MNSPEAPSDTAISFGPFQLDRAGRTLLRDGERIILPGKAFETLLALVEQAGTVVGKETLIARVWGGTSVEENNLAQSVSVLRKALGDHGPEYRYIVTAPGHGYSFIAPVTVMYGDSRSSRRRPPFHLAWLLVAAVILAGVVWWKWSSRPAALPELVLLTGTSGVERSPSFSPDGRSLAYAWWPPGEEHANLYIKLIGGGTPLRLAADVLWPAWSPDGLHIAYYRRGSPPSLWVIPALGGVERKVTSITPSAYVWGRPAWFPDGTHLVIPDTDPATGFLSLFDVSLATGERRRISGAVMQNRDSGQSLSRPASPARANEPLLSGDIRPAVSPDGRSLLFVHFQAFGVSAIYLTRSPGGEPRPLTPPKRYLYLAWSADGRHILYESSGKLWRMSASGGAAEHIAIAGEDVMEVAASPSGNRVAVSRGASAANLWSMEIGESGVPVQIAGTFRYQRTPAFSPDAQKLAFHSTRKGDGEIWTSDLDGRNLVQVTSMSARAGSPNWSPDGAEIAFDSRPATNSDVFIVNAAGGAPRRVTSDPAEDIRPSFSSDGRWIYFSSDRSGGFDVWKVPRGGGEAVRVTQHGGMAPAESPDGRFLYYGKDDGVRSLWRAPVTGGPESPVLLDAPGVGLWKVVGRGLVYAKNAVILLLDPETGRTSELAKTPKAPLDISVSADGRTIVYSTITEQRANIALLENVR